MATPEIRRSTTGRLLAAERFQAPVGSAPGTTAPPAACAGATTLPALPAPAPAAFLLPRTAAIWDQYGAAIVAQYPPEDWHAQLLRVPAFYRPMIVYGLCRHALADVFDDAGFSAWWRSPLDDLGGGTPSGAARENRCTALLEMVIDYIARGQL